MPLRGVGGVGRQPGAFCGLRRRHLRRIDSNTGRSSLRLTVDGDSPRVGSPRYATRRLVLWPRATRPGGLPLGRRRRQSVTTLRAARRRRFMCGYCGRLRLRGRRGLKVVCLERHADGGVCGGASAPRAGCEALCVSEDAEGRPTCSRAATRNCAYAASNGRSSPSGGRRDCGPSRARPASGPAMLRDSLLVTRRARGRLAPISQVRPRLQTQSSRSA